MFKVIFFAILCYLTFSGTLSNFYFGHEVLTDMAATFNLLVVAILMTNPKGKKS